MKPIDDFRYAKNNRILLDSDSLIQLYYPIIGASASAVYQYFAAFCDQGQKSHKFSQVLNHLQMGMTQLEEALVVLTALQLLELYQDPSYYVIKVNATKSREVFLQNAVLRRLLEKEIGQAALEELAPTVPPRAKSLSKRFSDVFGTEAGNLDLSEKKGIYFDLDSFQRLMARDGLRFKNEQEDVVALYALAEKYQLTWFDTYQLAKATAINYEIATTRMAVKKSQTESSPASDFTKAEKIVLQEVKKDTALAFLETIKQTRRATVTKDEKQVLVALAKMDFLDEVINVMVLYTFNKTKSANLQKTYIMKMANDFSYQSVKTAEEAILLLRSFKERKQARKTSPKSASKTNVPAWSNPNYQDQTSPEEQAALDAFKQKALKRLENLKKGDE
ncbi:DnaD domain protein [Streptococcus halichoeri]|uniref:DnaD domain protein n=1 Tax=Streptococcus halichoeri TaxID=254785 RepID=UPI0013599636|nr:DnaD domain protein [Streptococcus halichoeri]